MMSLNHASAELGAYLCEGSNSTFNLVEKETYKEFWFQILNFHGNDFAIIEDMSLYAALRPLASHCDSLALGRNPLLNTNVYCQIYAFPLRRETTRLTSLSYFTLAFTEGGGRKFGGRP